MVKRSEPNSKDKYAMAMTNNPLAPRTLNAPRARPLQPKVPPLVPTVSLLPSQPSSSLSRPSSSSQTIPFNNKYSVVGQSFLPSQSKKRTYKDKPTKSSIVDSTLSPHPAIQINREHFPYLTKPYFDRFFILEPEYLTLEFLDNPKKIVDKVIDKEFHRIPEHEQKRQNFYEFILVDTESIDIFECFDKHDSTKLAFIKIKIKRILSLKQWGGNPNSTRKFSGPFSPPEFNYWDYKDAWTKSLYRQNKGYSLSWLIYFDKNMSIEVPYWFHEWWDKFGPIDELFPPQLKESYKLWIETIQLPDHWMEYPLLFIFYNRFSLTWILKMEYAIQDTVIGQHKVPYFGRQIKIKWWNGMNLSNLTKVAMSKWFDQNPRLKKAS
ncbi:uncharacterized protein LOC131148954 isoform X2 [Malania oleifera]|nr:uncharacterized protein LOC131148954 isoform X2 [Malania oleifera]XP_057954919.1 uncharacterized protein LOC131148954 isoform X2 [Malania oleifera]